VDILRRTNRFYYTRPEGYPQIRVYHRKGSGKKSPRLLLKCGCCDEKLEIYYDDEGLEILKGALVSGHRRFSPTNKARRKSPATYGLLSKWC